MKKLLLSAVFATSAFALAACGSGGGNGEGEETKTLKIGASNVPHAEILEEAQPLLEEKGIELDIVPFQDYILPNKSLASKEIDANFFQHIPYLESQMAENKDYDFVNAGGIHIEPIGVYSKKHKSLEEIPEGGTIIMSNSVADHGRMLSLLESEGLITIKEGVDKTTATIDDIAENKKNLKFKADVEASILPQAYNNDEGDAVLINTNYAIGAGLNPQKDAIALEGSESPYVNIITVRKGDEDKKEIKALVEVLHSKEIQSFIEEKYEGAVVPVDGE
ncbi:MetQ/NlpA family ABC transporter substrate-binding protein [Bacillus sp. CMF21]|uniref:MetQ/NlpA family ABC transporter substrate-binding protein n=1 Tax=Metabacillus dongyingensis TaxID=2874282 RepID=UPI001CBC11B3|nr:MetQ/NlpA family ABC transporter substrate-binding protein [Metabacillus dongyingensis]UAL51742.1 MetQ/NlpA family ABC transporter substrate-binding protein [Metabacillus dongyingensis]USK28050.1 MetQ/NlpA family ABC transporter substrate-binding protein [Bacillus sp. CMF21]